MLEIQGKETAETNKSEQATCSTPMEWVFSDLLTDLASEITPPELEKIKYLFKEEVGKNICDHLGTCLAFFDVLRRQNFISSKNCVYLIKILCLLERPDLVQLTMEYCRKDKDIIYYYPDSTGYLNNTENVHFVCDTKSLPQETVKKLRHQVAEITCVPVEYVVIEDAERDHSIKQKFESKLQAKKEDVSCRKNTGWSNLEMDVFERPMCLISTGIKNVLSIENDVLEQISRIDLPMVIVSNAGPYRPGKSALLNSLAQTNKGFALGGGTIESTTKGIWVWCRIHPEKPNTVLVLLDTEGLGDYKKGDPNHDIRIFTLAVLLCNTLVWNMKGAFDQDAVNKLTFVTQMSRTIRFEGQCTENNEALKAILPEFVLCLRDFSLRLYIDGKGKLTEDEYLTECLKHQKKMDERYNKPRECIRDCFPDRRCFTLPVPGDSDCLENLETLKFDQLSKRFQEATVRFVSYIYSRDPKKLIVSKPVNGKMFEVLTTQYVEALNNDAVIDVDDAFTAVAKVENARVAAEAVKRYQSQMTLNYLNQKVVHDGKNICKNETKVLGSWLEFLKQMRDTENEIIGKDDALTEQQKQDIDLLLKEQDEKYAVGLLEKEMKELHDKMLQEQKALNEKDNQRSKQLLSRINYLEEEDRKRKAIFYRA